MRRTIVGVTAAAVGLTATGVAIAHNLANAQPRSGSQPNLVAYPYKLTKLAQGTDPLENPSGVYTKYGYLSDHATQASGIDSKTEPDGNIYLVTKDNPGGPTGRLRLRPPLRVPGP